MAIRINSRQELQWGEGQVRRLAGTGHRYSINYAECHPNEGATPTRKSIKGNILNMTT